MKQYQLTEGGSYQIGNMSIPPDPDNTDYQQLQWELAQEPPLAEVLPYVPPPPITDDEDIAKWMARNPWLTALIAAINRPVGHVKAFPIGGSLTAEQIAAILKANKP